MKLSIIRNVLRNLYGFKPFIWESIKDPHLLLHCVWESYPLIADTPQKTMKTRKIEFLKIIKIEELIALYFYAGETQDSYGGCERLFIRFLDGKPYMRYFASNFNVSHRQTYGSGTTESAGIAYSLPLAPIYMPIAWTHNFIYKKFEQKWGLSRHSRITLKKLKEILDQETYAIVLEAVKNTFSANKETMKKVNGIHKSTGERFPIESINTSSSSRRVPGTKIEELYETGIDGSKVVWLKLDHSNSEYYA